MPEIYDVIILGSGPAGLTAAIYTGRALLKTLVIAGSGAGGQLMLTSEVENFPGFSNAILGPELMEEMRKQAGRFGVEYVNDDATGVNFSSHPLKVYVGERLYLARSAIIASGASPKWLALESETRLRGHGVSSCATCLPRGSSIISNPHMRSIETIRLKDRVLTHLGTFKPVFQVYRRRYKGPLVKLKARYFGHEALRLTPNHPVLATKLFKGVGARYWNFVWERPRWVRAGNLTKSHSVLFPIPRRTVDRAYLSVSSILNLDVDSRGKARLKNESSTARRISNKIPVDNGFMRLAGYFLADGCITNRGFNIDFAAKEPEYIDDARQIIKRLFGLEPTVKRIQNVVRILAFSYILRDLMMSLFGRYSYGKTIPDWFLFLPRRKQAELVKGFWRGDGAKKTLGFEIITNSKKLVTQFQLILLRLGIIPSMHVQRSSHLNRRPSKIGNRYIRFKHDRYSITLAGSNLEKASKVLGVQHERLTHRTRSHHYAWLRDGFAVIPIRSISRERYSGYVYNLAVKGGGSYTSPIGALHNCDGYFFRGKELVVVGGGDTAMEEALFLTKFATTVSVIHRRDKLRASKILQDRAFKNEKIRFLWGSVVEEILGAEKVEGVRVKNLKSGDTSIIPCAGVFMAIGYQPNTDLFAGQLRMDKKGYIIAHDGVRTSVPGVFAAGDVHDFKYRQAVTAAGDGCKAALEAERYLEELKAKTEAVLESSV